MTEKPLAFLSLVKLLEGAVGQKTKYAILDPFPCTVVEAGRPAIIAVQNAGKTIAKHIGLSDLTFVIAVTTHEETTAGHIELNRDGSGVFVELAPDIFSCKDAVLATLSHELCHKYLHVHGINNGSDPLEQEFLTDVTAVYLGLGKIMLNGCECQSSYSRNESGKTTTTTRTLKTGYITRDCFSFVYRLVCGMRNLPADRILSGLSPAASDAIMRCEQEYADWFRPEYRSPEETEKLAHLLGEAVMHCQDEVALNHRAIRRCETAIRAVEVSLCDSHKPLKEAQEKIAALGESQPNPHLRYLSLLETKESVAQCVAASHADISKLKPALRQLHSTAMRLGCESEAASTEVIECPIDRTKLRVPAGRGRLLVACPSCKYKFVVNTAVDVEIANNASSKQAGFLGSLKAVFARNGR